MYTKEDQIYTNRFEPGVVALDFDAPTEYFYAPCNGRKEMIKQVMEIAKELSHKYGLGLFWLYETYSGIHVIFQCRLCSHEAALKVMEDANDRTGWHECGGHLSFADRNGYVELRVGCKPGREFDLYPYKPNPPASICPHVERHEMLLSMRLPAKN
jgi:hypothetical protein